MWPAHGVRTASTWWVRLSAGLVVTAVGRTGVPCVGVASEGCPVLYWVVG